MDIIKLCETPGILRALMILGYILQIEVEENHG